MHVCAQVHVPKWLVDEFNEQNYVGVALNYKRKLLE